MSHRRVVWLHDKEMTVPKCCSWATFASCFSPESPLAFWQSSPVLGLFAGGILKGIDRK